MMGAGSAVLPPSEPSSGVNRLQFREGRQVMVGHTGFLAGLAAPGAGRQSGGMTCGRGGRLLRHAASKQRWAVRQRRLARGSRIRSASARHTAGASGAAGMRKATCLALFRQPPLPAGQGTRTRGTSVSAFLTFLHSDRTSPARGGLERLGLSDLARGRPGFPAFLGARASRIPGQSKFND
jgi:hypothetical protein